MRQHYVAFYVQDDWRAGDSLSINYGLRYEFVTDPKELNDQMAGLLSSTISRAVCGRHHAGDAAFKNPSKKSFAPRLGVAWNPLGNKKQTVKGGYGVFYQPLTTSFYRGTTFRIYPYSQASTSGSHRVRPGYDERAGGGRESGHGAEAV